MTARGINSVNTWAVCYVHSSYFSKALQNYSVCFWNTCILYTIARHQTSTGDNTAKTVEYLTFCAFLKQAHNLKYSLLHKKKIQSKWQENPVSNVPQLGRDQLHKYLYGLKIPHKWLLLTLFSICKAERKRTLAKSLHSYTAKKKICLVERPIGFLDIFEMFNLKTINILTTNCMLFSLIRSYVDSNCDTYTEDETAILRNARNCYNTSASTTFHSFYFK